MHGQGIYQFADGHRYEGAFKNGWASGHGTATYPNKSVYQGYWEHGKVHGEGTRSAS